MYLFDVVVCSHLCSLCCLGQDGVAFIWEGDIIGNIIINDKPVGKLDIDKYKISVLHSPTGIGLNAIEDYLINVNQHVYVESESNNLVIVCADRSIRYKIFKDVLS